MRRAVGFLFVVLFLASLVSMAMAQEAESGADAAIAEQKEDVKAMDMENMKPMMMRHKEGMDMGKMAMMKFGTQTQIVAASDGGVIVLSGNKLLKYDSNLELKKEVEIPVPECDMHKTMMHMMKKYSDKDEAKEPGTE